MAKLGDRPTSQRGNRRREQLIEAGVALLAEAGWPGVTTRALAERADANVGLIHYHFGGLPDLHAAIAQKAAEEVIGPVLDALMQVEDLHAALDALGDLVPATTDAARTSRLAVELVAGGLRNPVLGEVLRGTLRRARAGIDARLAELHPSWPESRRSGAAVLVPALLDGLMLHRVLDPDLPVEQALATLGELFARPLARVPGTGPTDTKEMQP